MIPNDISQSVSSLAGGLGVVIAFMAVGLAIAQHQKKLTVVDTMWGIGFVLIAAETALISSGGDGDPAMRWILLAMAAVWGLRLAWHLHRRNSKLPEDPRYAELAEAGQLAGLELRHRQHARVEDRIREAKATGLRNLPCHRAEANAAWLEIIMAAIDLVAWTQLIGFTAHRELARCEIDTFRYRVLHVAARITRGARQIRLRIDATWRWATAISQAWQRLREAFP